MKMKSEIDGISGEKIKIAKQNQIAHMKHGLRKK